MKKENKIILAVILVAVFIISILGAGAVYVLMAGNDFIEPKDPLIPHIVEPYDDPWDDDTPPVITKYEDIAFLTWYGDALNDLQYYSNYVIDALDDQNYYSLEYWASEMEEFIDDELKPGCLDFYLSYDYDNLRDEFYDSLVDESWACFYMKWAGSYAQDGYYDLALEDLNTATSYTNKAKDHMQECQDLLDIIKAKS